MFLHTDAISTTGHTQGTFNENHIRGLGLKGMRVWDFGWQWATKGWRADKEGGDMEIGRSDVRHTQRDHTASLGRHGVWAPDTKPIWASGDCAAPTGRKHDRSRTTA